MDYVYRAAWRPTGSFRTTVENVVSEKSDRTISRATCSNVRCSNEKRRQNYVRSLRSDPKRVISDFYDSVHNISSPFPLLSYLRRFYKKTSADFILRNSRDTDRTTESSERESCWCRGLLYFCLTQSHVAFVWQVRSRQALSLWIPRVKPHNAALRSSGLSRYRNYLTGCFFQCRPAEKLLSVLGVLNIHRLRKDELAVARKVDEWKQRSVATHEEALVLLLGEFCGSCFDAGLDYTGLDGDVAVKKERMSF